jgi:hypothetical protein
LTGGVVPFGSTGPEEDGVAAKRLVEIIGAEPHPRLRSIAAATTAILCGIHLERVAGGAAEAAYLGVLFFLAGIAFGYVAWRLLRSDDVDGWVAAAALALGVAGGYLLSCTVGLPGLPTERWSGLGDASTSLAIVVVAVAGARSWRISRVSR